MNCNNSTNSIISPGKQSCFLGHAELSFGLTSSRASRCRMNAGGRKPAPSVFDLSHSFVKSGPVLWWAESDDNPYDV
ncbi:hypothetical protein RRG08_048668 [Elysia crispata]|uniref:Uncharacterized protein n=1 Tax=Elysia crispata TaxID=231223 RepID=A0AAE1DWH1_9GAST|nr:hypothetical protein RRG08_048668 [Elysia crispata]